MREQTNIRYRLKSTAVPGHTVSVEGNKLALYIEQSGQKLTRNYDVKLGKGWGEASSEQVGFSVRIDISLKTMINICS